ncbi:Trp biosynthesis-associated membrane protein [Nocardioides daphniae]|uniref:Membrane protein n=1 Tax=Nocardioides daphniae TaxID=402297 RepID=A0ABQ1Q959_9ACTN|nr:Trp biosynthesis-associated membrane protein [Nocardioides daphniae]GGD18947.1 membrane protein [Nocardioides daphniae]
MADRSFGPTLLAGLAGAGLAATAGHRDWVELSARGSDQAAADWFWQNAPGLGQMPASGALGLVALAAWGVLLVTRGAWRRAVAGLGLLASLGLAAVWVIGALTLRDDVSAAVTRAELAPGWSLGWTSWFVMAGIAVVLLVPAHVVALLRVPRWPAMGSRYDAPTGAPRPGAESSAAAAAVPVADLGEEDPADVWKAIDEGRDPTERVDP